MTSIHNKIMAVDDEPYNLEILEEILTPGYELVQVTDGLSCLAQVESQMPDVILLDVSMPDMDGYEVCRRLKDNPMTAEIPVMFVSARGALDERIQGYNCGGDDYIVKPFAKEELIAKLKGLVKVVESRDNLKQEVDYASQTAFNAMANSSEMGLVVQFNEHIQSTTSVDSLAKAMMVCLSQFGLKANIEFRHFEQRWHYADHGICSAMVIELFDLLKTKGRLYEFSPRLLVNYENLSLLILNMPVDDPERSGRLRDHLCFLVSVAEQHLTAIITSQKLAKQEASLQKAAKLIRMRCEDLMGTMKTAHNVNLDVFKDLQGMFEIRIPAMGLDEDQEQFIYRNLDEAIQRSVGRNDTLEEIQQAFVELEHDIRELLMKN